MPKIPFLSERTLFHSRCPAWWPRRSFRSPTPSFASPPSRSSRPWPTSASASTTSTASCRSAPPSPTPPSTGSGTRGTRCQSRFVFHCLGYGTQCLVYIFIFPDPQHDRQAPDPGELRRPLPQPPRRPPPHRPPVHPLPGHVPLRPHLHRGGHAKLHRQRAAQLCQDEDGECLSFEAADMQCIFSIRRRFALNGTWLSLQVFSRCKCLRLLRHLYSLFPPLTSCRVNLSLPPSFSRVPTAAQSRPLPAFLPLVSVQLHRRRRGSLHVAHSSTLLLRNCDPPHLPPPPPPF